MKTTSLSLLVFISFIGSSFGHTYHLGGCPVVDPMHGFEMNKMLGVWYAVQKTSTASSCITYNFTRGEEPGEYELQQVSQHFVLGLTPLKHDYKYKGRLSMNDASMPARMTVKFPLSVAGSATYTIFGTDYENYAGIFTCQKLTFAHRQSATILSRRRDLDKIYLDKARSRLSAFGVDPYDLSIISQKNCPKHPNGTTNGVDININPDTFSAHNVAGVIRKTGEKIGDGFEYVASAGKNAYNHLSNKDSPDKDRITEYDPTNLAVHARASHPDDEVEWLP
ncbi:apolipoprotein D-like [Arctopsyche grandis]|uniref:apolipoprotein D-like n=1 Tax=Arctopsyche grandis TaxID=121162 RepID=UPI00406DA44B